MSIGNISTAAGNASRSLPSINNWLDKSVELVLELGQLSLTVDQLLRLQHGDVLRLEQAAPFRLLAEGRLIAYGEVRGTRKEGYHLRLTRLVDASTWGLPKDS